jgi:hypothetical protein
MRQARFRFRALKISKKILKRLSLFACVEAPAISLRVSGKLSALHDKQGSWARNLRVKPEIVEASQEPHGFCFCSQLFFPWRSGR